MDQITEHINSSNQKIHSCDKMRKMTVNLGSNKFENNNNSTCQLIRLHNSLLMNIFDTPEKDLSNVYLEILHNKITYIFITLITNIILLFNTCNIQ